MFGRTGRAWASMLASVIATDRLILRPWVPKDAPSVVEYANDREWGRYPPVPFPYSLVDRPGRHSPVIAHGRRSSRRDYPTAAWTIAGRCQTQVKVVPSSAVEVTSTLPPWAR